MKITIFLLVAFVAIANARLREGDCEVCLKLVEKFKTDSKGAKTQEKIENSIRKTCKGLTNNREKRLCYYIGGTDDAATGTLRGVSGPIKNGLPADRICEKLKKADAQICELRYEKEIDVTKMNLKKSRVKELKNVLSQWGEKCNGCTSKADYVKRIEELMPKHAKKKEL